MVNVVHKPALQAVHLGNPKDVLKMPGENARLLLGIIFGVAQKTRPKITMDKAGNAQNYEQIVGDFEGIPAEKQNDVEAYRSNVLYLPEVIHEPFAKTLNKDDAEPIKFAIELWVAKEGKGLRWEAKSLIPVEVIDPLAEIRALLVGKTVVLGEKKATVKK